MSVTLDFDPFPTQQRLHQVHTDETLFGGAAGGGKSAGTRAEAMLTCMQVPGLRAVIFRRTFPDLERSVIEPLRQEMPAGAATYNGSKHVWRFTNGAILELGSLDRDSDVLKYQGAEYQLQIWEELTQFTEHQYTYLRSRLRAGGKVKERLAQLGWRPRCIATTNPGGPGHLWVKRRFIDPAPADVVWQPKPTYEEPHPGTRIYIPSRVSQNPHVDAAYMDRLNSLPPALRKALRDGDWNILDGVRFSQWSENMHVVPYDRMLADGIDPTHPAYERVVGVDYGMTAPFAAHWMVKLPTDQVYVYRELNARHLTPAQQAAAIAAAETPTERGPGRRCPVVLDAACWARSPNAPTAQGRAGRPPRGSIAEAYWEVFGSDLRKSHKDRLGAAAQLDSLLTPREDGRPGIIFADTCRSAIATIPALPRAKANPEDVLTTADDHDYDSLSYGLFALLTTPERSKGVADYAVGRADDWSDVAF